MKPVGQVLGSPAMRSQDKVLTLDRLLVRVSEWHSDGDVIVFTNGCFDLLHTGHITLLEECRKFGDRVIVGINSDESVRKLKGSGRPVVFECDRARIVAALAVTDAVVLFSEDTPIELIRRARPDVLVKGGDYSQSSIVGADDVRAWGGKVEIVAIVEGFSTTKILQRIMNQLNVWAR
jgi:D-beta-D-heptose 7-phosphate kinase / D-beta-D-heptose 1-phosphate adenosyltransferase